MIACAKSLVIVLLTDKWIPCIIFVQICALYGLWGKPQIICQEALKARGLSNRALQIEIIRKVFEIGILIPSVLIGIKAIALSASIACILSWGPVAYYSRKELCYSYREQFSDVAPAFLVSLIMGCAVLSFNLLPIKSLYILAIQMCSGFILYVFLVFFFKVPGREIITDKLLDTEFVKRIRKSRCSD